MGKDVIVALDFDSKEKTLAFLDRFTEEKPFVKIGMELFYAEGPSIVREIRARGHKIFLDLKLHDIPNTVKKAMAALSALDVDIVNLHAAGTAAMMTAALEGLTRPDGTRLIFAIILNDLGGSDALPAAKERVDAAAAAIANRSSAPNASTDVSAGASAAASNPASAAASEGASAPASEAAATGAAS